MCKLKDYEQFKMVEPWRGYLEKELESWHRLYLPVKGNIVDMGAGCGETALFYLRHGADRIVCFESHPSALECLKANFGTDPRVTIIPMRIDDWKSDIEGSERG